MLLSVLFTRCRRRCDNFRCQLPDLANCEMTIESRTPRIDPQGLQLAKFFAGRRQADRQSRLIGDRLFQPFEWSCDSLNFKNRKILVK